MQLARLTNGPDYRCTWCQGIACPLNGRPQREVQVWQAGGGSFLLLPRRCFQQPMAVNFQPRHMCKPPGRSSKSCYQFSLPATSLSRHMAACTALACGVQCTMPVRLGHWQSQTSNICRGMIGQWSDSSAMSSLKTLSPSGPMSYLLGLASRIWTSFWRRKGSASMDMWNSPIVQSKQQVDEKLGPGRPKMT